MDTVVIVGKPETIRLYRKSIRKVLLRQYRRVLWKNPRAGIEKILSPFLPRRKNSALRIELLLAYERGMRNLSDPQQVLVLEDCLISEQLRCQSTDWHYLTQHLDFDSFVHAETCYHKVILLPDARAEREKRLWLGHPSICAVTSRPLVGLETPSKRYLIQAQTAAQLSRNSTIVMQEECFHHEMEATLLRRNRSDKYTHFVVQNGKHTPISESEHRRLSGASSGKVTLKKLAHFILGGHPAKVESYLQPPMGASVLEVPQSLQLPDQFPVVGRL